MVGCALHGHVEAFRRPGFNDGGMARQKQKVCGTDVDLGAS